MERACSKCANRIWEGMLALSRWGETGGAVVAAQRGEETLMSEVSHVEDCICLATIQGHTETLSSFLFRHREGEGERG